MLFRAVYLQQGSKVHCTNELLLSCCHTTLCCTLWHFVELNFLESPPPRPAQQLASFLFLFYFLLSAKNLTWQLSAACCKWQKRVREEAGKGATVSDDLWGVCLSVCVSVCLSVWWFSGVSVCSCQTMWRRLVCSVLSVRVLPQSDCCCCCCDKCGDKHTTAVCPSLSSPAPVSLSACLSQCLHMKPQARQIKHRQIYKQSHNHTHTLSIPGQETNEGWRLAACVVRY